MSVKPVSTNTIINQLQWRYATKKFDPTRKISAADWAALEESLILTPSSFGLQPWKFIVVTDPATKEKLVPVSWGQTQPKDCSHMVIFATRKTMDEQYIDRFLETNAQVRGVGVETMAGFRKMLIGSILQGPIASYVREWATRQVYIALGQFMSVTAMLGIDTCPMEGLEPSKYDEILGLTKTDYATAVACPAGYRAADDKYATMKKVRFSAADVVQHI